MSDFESLSAAKKKEAPTSPVRAQLVAVELSTQEYREYVSNYLPRPTAFIPIAEELAAISARFNGYMAFLRYVLTNARYLSTKNSEEVRTILNAEASRILTNVLVTNNVKSAAKAYLESMQQSSPFIITPVSGGYDANFVGGSLTNPQSCYVMYNENHVPMTSHIKLSENEAYKNEKLEAYSTELSLGAIRAGKNILSSLFDASVLDSKSAGQRKIVTVGLDFDFESLNDVFFQTTGVALSVNFMKNISPNIVRQFGSNTRVSLVRSPAKDFVRIATTKSQGYDLSEHITEEGLALSQMVSVAQTLHIPEKLAKYICQSESGKISYMYLSTWLGLWNRRYLRPLNYRSGQGNLDRRDMPYFIVPLSKIKKTTEIRKLNNFAVEPGKGDEHNIYIAANGGLAYGLPTSLRTNVEKNLDDYEKTMDDFYEHCYSNGLTMGQSSLTPEEAVIIGHEPSFDEGLRERRAKVNSFAGKILTYDWDYNVTVTAGVEDPAKVNTSKDDGSARLDTLTKADYLGFDFAEPGERPIRKTFADSLVLMLNMTVEKDGNTSSTVGHRFYQEGTPIGKLIAFYRACLQLGLTPKPQELLDTAIKSLGLENLDTAPYLQNRTYSNVLSNDFKLQISDEHAITSLLQLTVDFCSGTFKMRDMVAEEIQSNDQDAIEEAMETHPIYFKYDKSRLRDFGNLYNMIGGKVFQLMCQSVTEVPSDKLFVGDHANRFSFKALSTEVLPLAVMFAHYVPRAEEIFESAKEEVESNKPDPNLDVSDIKVPGSVNGAQFFPHQVRTHGSLRKRPTFAIMDIRPGGGKTMLGLSDIAALIGELDELGESIKPLIICPDNLIVNWVNDMKTMTDTNWNMIPINNAIADRWGYDKLEETINNAPKNTICAVGMNFLTSKSEFIVLGTAKVKVSNNLEFMKRLGFNYIVIDESQKCANKVSVRHRNIKMLTTASHVKYLRLASGTFIHGRVSDAIGQVALYNGHIFRDGDVLTGSESDTIVNMNGEDIPIWKVDTPARVRQKLSRYASIVTLQKKHWAFMLPSPIESFFAIPFVPSDNDPTATEEDRTLGELHRQLYDTVLNESLEQLEELAKNAKSKRVSDEDEDDEEDSESDDDEGDEESDSEVDFDLDDEELKGLSSNDLKPYIQRLERLLTNPMADPLAPSIFGLAGVTKYNSALARFVAKRIDHHFNPEVWSKDKNYNEYNLVSHGGKLWLAKKVSPGVDRPPLPKDSVGVSPDKSDYWREEPQGKIIVFCRYINSVQGVYEALPAKYKSMAVKYSGAEGDSKLSNLDAFKNDPRVQILVANEMGISEGHNLQLASRIIRVESPWSPGDLDQSASRIFRPDPAASKAMRETGRKGELYREVVYLDWLVCDGTLHVQKQARLIAKIFNKARFDEAGNPTYEPILREFDLPEIPMGLGVLRSRSTLEEYSSYRKAYSALNGAQLKEFHDMRETQDPSMQDLPTTPMLPGMRKIDTPYISNQRPDDPQGLGLESLRNVFRTMDVSKNLDSIKGLPVVTDLGKGRIARYRTRYKFTVRVNEDGHTVYDSKGKPIKDPVFDSAGNQVINELNPITSVTVKLVSGETVILKDSGLLYVATKLSKANEKDFAVRNLELTEAQERKAEEREERDAEKELKRAMEEQKRLRREQRAAADRAAAAADGKKRKENIKRGKPINAGIKRVAEVPSMPSGVRRVKEVPPIGVEGDNEVTLHPAYYHGYLTLEVRSDDPDAMKLKKLKFREVPSYAYVRCTKYAQYAKILDYLEDTKKFVLSPASVKRLDEIQAAFEEDKKAIYRMELAPQGTLPLFFATSQKKVTTRKEIKPYPIVMPNELQIAVDIAACPIIKSHIGITVPGAGTKWVQHPGHYMYFAKDKNDMKAKVKEIEALGIVVTNKAEALSEIADIKFRSPRAKK